MAVLINEGPWKEAVEKMRVEIADRLARCEQAEAERDAARAEAAMLRATIDRHVAEKAFHQLSGGCCWFDDVWYPDRSSAEAAYRQRAFPGLDVDKDTKGA